jgi:hypothetical protein
VVLQIRYDYSAFSVLQMQVMSEQHRTDSGIDVRSKRSETADTPVETFIQANAPATYRTARGSDGEIVDRVATPIRTEIGLSADEDNIRYKVDPESFEFEDSGLTEAISDTCGGLQDEGEDSFSLDPSIQDQIETTQQGETSEWFSSRSKPSSAYCAFTYEPREISPTGETITFTARADYTVLQDEPNEEAFTMRNTLCRTQNCPQVLPLDLSENADQIATTLMTNMETGSDLYRTKKYSKCGQPQDAQNGCSVIESFSLEDRVGGAITDTTIREGDIALRLQPNMGGENFYTCYTMNSADPDYGIVSISERDLKAVWQGQQKALNYTDGGWSKVTLYRSDPNPSEGCTTPQQEQDSEGGEDEGSTTGPNGGPGMEHDT